MRSSPGEVSPLLQQLVDSEAQIVSEPVLVAIAKGPLNDFVVSSTDISAVERIRASLHKTFLSSNLAVTHRAAICKTVSLLFEAALRSREPIIHRTLLSEECWFLTFEAFLDTYEQCKPRTMRQTLATLIKVLEKHPDQGTAQAIISSVIPLLLRILVFGEPRSRVKASLMSVEHFLRKDLLSISQLSLFTYEHLNRSDQSCRLLRVRCEESGVATTTDYHEYIGLQAFITAIILGALEQSYLPSVGSLCGLLVQKVKRESQGLHPRYTHDEIPFWARSLRSIALANLDSLDLLNEYVFRPLFNADPSALQVFLHTLPLRVIMSPGESAPVDQLMLLLAMLVIAKELNVVQEETDSDVRSAVCTPENAFIIPSSRIGDFITHSQPQIRLSALSFLIKGPSTSKPLSKDALATLRDKLPYVQSDPDPYYRGVAFSLIRHLFVRLRGGMITLHRGNSKLDTKDSDTLMSSGPNTHVHFLEWYISFLQGELHPAASYQRHISALNLLLLLVQSGLDFRIDPSNLAKIGLVQVPWPQSVTIFSSRMLRLLGDLIADAFEDVRASSSLFLGLFPRQIISDESLSASGKTSLLSQLQTGITRAEHLASSTSRADHTDTVGRLYQIIFNISSKESSLVTRSTPARYITPAMIVDNLSTQLSDILKPTDEKLQRAMSEKPFHGYISAMRFIICSADFYTVLRSPSGDAYDYPQFHKTIVSLCTRIWLGVRDILCIDSPEGQQQEETVEDLGPKDLLSCSWRALRESSLLLHAVLTNAPKNTLGCLTHDDLSAIGSLSFTQLAELRHRGAFSTVAQTFAVSCERSGKASDPKSRQLPSLWYNQFKEILDAQSSQLTRRSAGLPALITGIALADPETSFHIIVHDLQLLVKTPLNNATDGHARRKLPQVHALNCLKDIFTNTKLAPWTERHIMPTLEISAHCLGSQTWAIRNCGLMLFHALMKRMCRAGSRTGGFGGVSGAEPGCRIVFEQKPELIPLLSNLLDTSVPGSANSNKEGSTKSWELSISTERVFPALELIGEKIPAANPDHDIVFRTLASRQFGSPVWAIRDHAARIYAALVDPSSTVRHNNKYLEDLSLHEMSQNEIHGHALCLRYCLARVWASNPPVWKGLKEDPMHSIEKTFDTLFDVRSSPYILATLIHILSDSMVTKIVHHQEEIMVSFYDRLSSRHDFAGILQSLLSPTTSYSVRSSFLLLSAMAYCHAIHLLSKQCAPEAISFLDCLTKRDVDASRWVLEQLRERYGSVDVFLFGKLEIYATFSREKYPETIRALAMEGLAHELLLSYSRDGNITEILTFVRSVDATVIHGKTPTDAISNREFSNGLLFLQGCVLPLKLQAPEDFTSSREISSFARQLAFASHDETEFSTRHAALLSLKAFFSCARLLGLLTAQYHSLYFGLYLVLYDTLNDDDEDLRDIAADVASMVLLEWNRLRGKSTVSLVPLAAGDQFIAFLGSCATSFDDDLMRIFVKETRKRMLGDALKDGVLLPATDILSSINKQKTALFEEEKQNLFIDDIREMKRWSDLLASVTAASMRELVFEVHSWASTGLSVLTGVLTATDHDGILGWTSKADVYTLGMRILFITQALLKRKDPFDAGYSRAHLQVGVKNFIEAARQADAHADWIELAKEI